MTHLSILLQNVIYTHHLQAGWGQKGNLDLGQILEMAGQGEGNTPE